MYIIISSFIISLSIFFSFYYIQKNINTKESIVTAYYNSGELFAGFIQYENDKIRAREFSTNGSILSCSKWFDNRTLNQGKNEGLGGVFLV